MSSSIPGVKIVSDGTPRGTHVFTRGGEELKGLIGVDFSITPDRGSVAVLSFGPGGYEVIALAQIAAPAQEPATLSFDEWMHERIQRAHEEFMSIDLGKLDERNADAKRNASTACGK